MGGWPPAITVRDVPAYLNVSEKTVYHLAQWLEFPEVKLVGAWRFRPADIRRWMETQKSSAGSRGEGR